MYYCIDCSGWLFFVPIVICALLLHSFLSFLGKTPAESHSNREFVVVVVEGRVILSMWCGKCTSDVASIRYPTCMELLTVHAKCVSSKGDKLD